MEKNPRIFEMPVPIGGYVWDIYNPKIPQKVIGYRIGRMAGEDEEDYREDFPELEWYIQYDDDGVESSAPVSEIGVSIFLTQEEAENRKIENEEI